MIKGFCKWPAQTTTSSSRKHLHIYHALIHTYRQPLSAENTQQKSIVKTALKIQWLIMNLAIWHCYTYKRWKTVHNNFLEKIMGKPLLEKLQVIHIYKADWNYILKYFVAKTTLTKGIKRGHNMQWASRQPSRQKYHWYGHPNNTNVWVL